MGKYSIMLVFVLTVMLGIILPNVHGLGNRSVENFLKYSMQTQSHNLAMSGANSAATRIYLDPAWRDGFSEKTLNGGVYNVSVTDLDSQKIQILSVGRMGDDFLDTVLVVLKGSSFSRFAYYSKVEGGITWITGDTVWGPFHTQDQMRISGTPVYKGKASAKNGTNPANSSAKFEEGFTKGVNIDLPLNLDYTTQAAINAGRVFATGDLWLNFTGTSVEWRTTAGGTPTTSALTDFAPNGVVMVKSGNIHIQGVVDGRVTLCAEAGAVSSAGNIYVDDDIRYAHDPRTTTTSNILGLIAENSTIITDNAANNSNVTIQAAIFCHKGGLTAQNYNSRPVSGRINLLGGVVQYQRGAVGTFSSSSGTPTISTGFLKNYRYDDRFYLDAPPFYPWTGGYQVVTWME
jgi:hypothetical protein